MTEINGDIIVVYCEKFMRFVNTTCGQSGEWLGIITSGKYTNYWLERTKTLTIRLLTPCYDGKQLLYVLFNFWAPFWSEGRLKSFVTLFQAELLDRILL